MAFKSIILFLLSNIMFLSPMHADLFRNLHLPGLVFASTPSPQLSGLTLAPAPSDNCPVPSPTPSDADMTRNPTPLDPDIVTAPSPEPSSRRMALVAADIWPALGLAPSDTDMAPAPSPAPSSTDMAPAPSQAPSSTGMAPAPSQAPSSTGMAPSPSPAPSSLSMETFPLSVHPGSPAMGPVPDSDPFDMGIHLPPDLAKETLNLDCTGCRIDPFALAACGNLINGTLKPDTLNLCCSALSSLSRQDASVCLCHAIKIEALVIADFDVPDAIRKALAGCRKY